jgi:hypothetical protein
VSIVAESSDRSAQEGIVFGRDNADKEMVEAARITWRPLGRLLVEQGLLTTDELEHALAKQRQTGRRLGETIVECGFVSGPDLAGALAAQYGIELTTEQGFGTGLRSEIQRRHESDRRRVVQAVPDPIEPVEVSAEPGEAQPEPEPDAEHDHEAAEARLLAQLEEQWAKLAAAEASLAARERELADAKTVNQALREEIRALRRASEANLTAAQPSHLVFVQLAGRYALLERDGPPPAPCAELALPTVDDGAFVVTGSRRSPLPGDTRLCVVAERVRP